MHVVGAGFGRTGTNSLKVALEQLYGGTCYHMFEVLKDNERIHSWYRIAHGETPDWQAMMDGFTCAVDWPVARFWRELADAFPEAKVVLTKRDPDRWYESVRETIYGMSAIMERPPVKWLVASHPGRRYFPSMADRLIWGEQGHFGGRFEDKDHAISVYEAHNEEVQRTIPADRLLVFEVKQGWEPLCEFLGQPVPEGEFPHTNARAQMKKLRRGLVTAATLTVPITAPLAAVRAITGRGVKR